MDNIKVRVPNGRRKKKFINSLMSEEGENLRSSDDILEEIMNFFGNLYSKSGRNSWRVEGLDWSLISAHSSEWLDRPFLEEEVCCVVFQLSREKAPGPNGFAMALY